METTKILNEWWKLKFLLTSLGYKSRAYEKMKANKKMEAEKKNFQLRKASKRRHWETASFIM